MSLCTLYSCFRHLTHIHGCTGFLTGCQQINVGDYLSFFIPILPSQQPGEASPAIPKSYCLLLISMSPPTFPKPGTCLHPQVLPHPHSIIFVPFLPLSLPLRSSPSVKALLSLHHCHPCITPACLWSKAHTVASDLYKNTDPPRPHLHLHLLNGAQDKELTRILSTVFSLAHLSATPLGPALRSTFPKVSTLTPRAVLTGAVAFPQSSAHPFQLLLWSAPPFLSLLG